MAGLTKTSLSSRACVAVRLVRLLLLELGRESGSLLVSLLPEVGSKRGILCEPWSPPRPLRALTREFCRLKLPPGWALHRLLWLSDRFNIALCTKPPMPFVGEAGRSCELAMRACEEDMVSVRPTLNCSLSATDDAVSDAGAAFSCSASAAIRDFRSGLLLTDVRAVEKRLLEKALSRIELGCDAVSDITLSEGAGLPPRADPVEVSLDMPGSPLLPDATLSPPPSSLVLRYAAFPAPLSAVCLNHDGSRDASDAAI